MLCSISTADPVSISTKRASYFVIICNHIWAITSLSLNCTLNPFAYYFILCTHCSCGMKNYWNSLGVKHSTVILGRPNRFVYVTYEDTIISTPSNPMVQQPLRGSGLPCCRGFTITFKTHTQSVGLPWKSDRPDVETYTWQHTTLTRDRHRCSWWDSNA